MSTLIKLCFLFGNINKHITETVSNLITNSTFFFGLYKPQTNEREFFPMIEGCRRLEGEKGQEEEEKI